MTAVIERLGEAALAQLRAQGDAPEAGFHWHPVDRAAGTIPGGGDHAHLFHVAEAVQLEGGFELSAGMMLITETDGAHLHELDGVEKTKEDGAHSHRLLIQAGESELELRTAENGAASHALMVARTGLGGAHQHELELPSGVKLKSLTVAEFLALVPPSDAGGDAG